MLLTRLPGLAAKLALLWFLMPRGPQVGLGPRTLEPPLLQAWHAAILIDLDQVAADLAAHGARPDWKPR